MTEPQLTVDNLTSDRLDELIAAEQELARLRAGEELVTSPYISLSPGQWVWEWNRATPAKRLEVAADAIRDRSTASTCFFLAHEKRLKESGHAWVALARVRDVLADMENITGARHWASILRKAVDGEQPPGPAATEATQPACGSACAEGHTYGFRCEQQRSRVVTVEGDPAAAHEAIRQMDADTTEPHTGLVVQPYRDHGEQKWVFRCWGTDTCDGRLSLDHHSAQSAQRARDRHVTEEHPNEEQPMPATDTIKTATASSQLGRIPQAGEIWHPCDDPTDSVTITAVNGNRVFWEAPADIDRQRNSSRREAGDVHEFVKWFFPASTKEQH